MENMKKKIYFLVFLDKNVSIRPFCMKEGKIVQQR